MTWEVEMEPKNPTGLKYLSRALKCLLLRGLDHEFYFSILLVVSSFEVTNSYFSMIVYAYLQKHLFKP